MLGVEAGHGLLAQEALSLVFARSRGKSLDAGDRSWRAGDHAGGPRDKPTLSRSADWSLPRGIGDGCVRSRSAGGGDARAELYVAALHVWTPTISWDDLRVVAPLAVLIALVVMVQTAATTRSFPNSAEGPDVNQDFIGVGAANVFAGLVGVIPWTLARLPRRWPRRLAAGRSLRGGPRPQWRFASFCSRAECSLTCRPRRWPASSSSSPCAWCGSA